MPPELLRMMLSTLPILTEIRTVDQSGRPISGLILRSARSRDWSFCLGLVHNEETGITCAILNGMQSDEIGTVLKCLVESNQCLHDPMLLPVFLLELKVHYFAVLLEDRAKGIEAIELATGMRHGFSSDPQRKEAKRKERDKLLKDLDFDEITRKLTGVTGTLAFCDMTFGSSLRALALVSAVRDQLFAVQAQHKNNVASIGTRALDTRLAYLKELIIGAQAHSGVLSARTKAQVQTVNLDPSHTLLKPLLTVSRRSIA